MFALELLGWGWFLGLTAFAFAALFDGCGLERATRWSFVTYGVLGVTSALGYIPRGGAAELSHQRVGRGLLERIEAIPRSASRATNRAKFTGPIVCRNISERRRGRGGSSR